MIPDIEKVVSKYLRERPEIVALSARVVGKTPDSTSTAWVRVTRLDAPSDPRDPADHAIAFLLQLDCYAGSTGGQPEANLLGRTVRDVLSRVNTYAHPDAVLSGARVSGDARIPDNDFEPARDRTILTATVWAHAIPA